jgi:hypothetical protein
MRDADGREGVFGEHSEPFPEEALPKSQPFVSFIFILRRRHAGDRGW